MAFLARESSPKDGSLNYQKLYAVHGLVLGGLWGFAHFFLEGAGGVFICHRLV